jgi:HAD superfamily hydrolase (TIGR01509 family)
LVTNSSICTRFRFSQALNLHDTFDVIATRESVRRAKPDPEIYLFVAERLGVWPSETLVIEDSPPGIQAALAAGMSCVAGFSGSHF